MSKSTVEFPTVSVIIPTYGGAGYLGEAIQSVLDQTYPNFELIVVNDASPDKTTELMQKFEDERLIYIVHETNQGAVAARKTGLEASSGELIALLDHDDLFHPEKLEAHVEFLADNPEIGVSYNGRFEINETPQNIRDIWQPTTAVTLQDIIVTFPFAPSDMVTRRKWVFHEGVSDYDFHTGEEVIVEGGEYVYCGRLLLAGCKFGGIDRALNYRRYHPLRVFSDLGLRCHSEHACQEMIFTDQRCPDEVLNVRDLAHSNTNLVWAYYSFAQGETELGQKLLREAIRLRPEILDGTPCHVLDFLIMNSIYEEGRDHSDLLRTIFDQLPTEVDWLSDHFEWAVALGHLLKGARAVMWGDPEAGQYHFSQADEMNATVDEVFIQKLTYQLLLFNREFGSDATLAFLDDLSLYLNQTGNQKWIRWLKGNYSIGQAFQSYEQGDYGQVRGGVIQAIISDPRHVTNRGVWSIFIRSLLPATQTPTQSHL